jgi:hypothetical protein
MFHENEILMLLLGLGALVLVWGNYARLRRYRAAHLFLWSFAFMLLGWVLTILEGLFLYSMFNFFEHLCYLVGSIFLTCWVWRITHRQEQGR